MHTPCLGKFGLSSKFVSKVAFMPHKISRSLGVSRVMKTYWLRKRSFHDLDVILDVSNAFYMACSDKQYLFREQTLCKSCVIDATNFSQNAMSQNDVFQRFLEIHPVDLAGSAKINYSKSMRICQCIRHVQENCVCLPILCPKFRSCHPKFRGRWESVG